MFFLFSKLRFFLKKILLLFSICGVAYLGNNSHTYKVLGDFISKSVLMDDSQKSSIFWYELAAQKGCMGSKVILADYYYNDKNDPANLNKAFTFYQEAAKQGNVRALNQISYMYFTGEGVNKNILKAKFWYQKLENSQRSWLLKD